MKFGIWGFFENLPIKFKFHLNRIRLTGTLHEDQCTFFKSYLAHFFLEWEMFQTNLVEKMKTPILFRVTFFRKSCRLWDNLKKKIVERGGPQIWRMRVACCIPKATNTHALRFCNTHCFSTATVVAWTPVNVTLNVHWLSCNITFPKFAKLLRTGEVE